MLWSGSGSGSVRLRFELTGLGLAILRSLGVAETWTEADAKYCQNEIIID